MSLRVWLPLNGNLENKGISDITVTNNGATIDNNGKIGKCYSFDGVDDWIKITIPSDMTTIKNSSIAFWGMGNRSFGGISHDGGATLATCTFYTSWQFANSSWTYINGGTVSTTDWHHYAITINNDTIITYCDGMQVVSTTLASNIITDITSSNFIEIGCDHPGGDEYGAIKVNDFRVYDHCLSQKEVKEISQGLILHYKLDEIMGNNLFLTNTQRKYIANHYDAYQFHLTENLQADKTYTIQLWNVDVYHPDKNLSQTGIHLYWGGGSVHITNWKGADYFTQTSDTNFHADYLTATFTINSTQANGTGATNSYLVLYNSTPYVANANMFMHVGRWKIENGSAATTWCPAASETEKGQYIPDSSGYGNDGVVEGNISLSTDSPRHGMSTYFNNDAQWNCGIFVNNFTTPFEQYTISIWIKDSIKDKMSLGNNSSLSNRTNQFYLYGDNSWRYVHGGTAGEYYFSHNNSATIGDWIHYGIVYDGSKVQIYRNGTDEGSKDTTGLATFNNISLGVAYTNSSYQAPSYISDFRIYATALSAEDVVTLYHTSAQVDDLGSFHAFELKEESGNQFAAEEIIKNSATSVEWDNENKRYVITSPVGTSSWGYGFKIKSDVENNRKIIPWGKTSIFTFEVYSPIATIGATDYNNYAIDNSQTGGNDNDGARGTANFDIPANTWTLCTLSLTNNNSTKNPNQVALYDCSTFGLRTNGMSESLVWYMRNPQWYLVETEKFQVEQNGVFKTNFIKEDDLKNYASFRDNEKAAWANNFIEK